MIVLIIQVSKSCDSNQITSLTKIYGVRNVS